MCMFLTLNDKLKSSVLQGDEIDSFISETWCQNICSPCNYY